MPRARDAASALLGVGARHTTVRGRAAAVRGLRVRAMRLAPRASARGRRAPLRARLGLDRSHRLHGESKDSSSRSAVGEQRSRRRVGCADSWSSQAFGGGPRLCGNGRRARCTATDAVRRKLVGDGRFRLGRPQIASEVLPGRNAVQTHEMTRRSATAEWRRRKSCGSESVRCAREGPAKP